MEEQRARQEDEAREVQVSSAADAPTPAGEGKSWRLTTTNQIQTCEEF